jgi:hypothetical protein
MVFHIDKGSLRRSSSPSTRDVEGAKLLFVVMLARVQGVEVRDAIDVQDHGLSFEYEALLTDFAGGVHLITLDRRVGPWPASGPTCQSPQ